MTDPTPESTPDPPASADGGAPDDAPRAGSPPEAFLAAATELGLDFGADELAALETYLDRLLTVNRQFNLTRIVDPAEAWTRHVLDSLSLLPWVLESKAERLLDVGSGGGLPGIPLAITAPHVDVTLLEATGKKARFLEETAAALGLERVRVISERAEVIGHDRREHREKYDIVTARAVGRLPVLLEYAIPLVRRGGLFLAIKGEQAEAEIEESHNALGTLMARVVDVVRTGTGTIVVMEKTGLTPRDYPRRVGEPKRVPLV